MEAKQWYFTGFTDDDYLIPHYWRCPSCGSQLVLNKDNIKYFETLESLNEKHLQGGYAVYRFAAMLKCRACEESISLIGVAEDRAFEGENNNGEYVTLDYVNFSPLVFNPPLHIFEIPKKCPHKIRLVIYSAFGLLFNDPASCANKIRMTVEVILDHFGIKKTQIVKGKREPMFAHSRIKLFEKTMPQVAELMLAIKWIGNEGSHAGKKLTRSELLQGFELLENILELLYGDKQKRLQQLARKINKRKGIVPKRKSRKHFF